MRQQLEQNRLNIEAERNRWPNRLGRSIEKNWQLMAQKGHELAATPFGIKVGVGVSFVEQKLQTIPIIEFGDH